MDVFMKVTAGILIAVVLSITLAKQGKDIALVLTVGVCAMVATIAVSYLQPVIDFMDKLQSIGNLNAEMISILLKTVGVGLVAEVVSLICADSGNSAMSKTVQILSGAVILWMSIPLLNKLIELVESILSTV